MVIKKVVKERPGRNGNIKVRIKGKGKPKTKYEKGVSK